MSSSHFQASTSISPPLSPFGSQTFALYLLFGERGGNWKMAPPIHQCNPIGRLHFIRARRASSRSSSGSSDDDDAATRRVLINRSGSERKVGAAGAALTGSQRPNGATRPAASDTRESPRACHHGGDGTATTASGAGNQLGTLVGKTSGLDGRRGRWPPTTAAAA